MWDRKGRETENIKQIIILNQYQTHSLPQYEKTIPELVWAGLCKGKFAK